MRLLIVTGIYPPDIGGPATYLGSLVRSLRLRGDEVSVITLADGDPAGSPTQEDAGVIRIPRSLPPWRRFPKVVRVVRRAAKRADVVYVNGLFVEAAAACRGLPCRRVAKVVGDWAWERVAVRGWFPPEIDAFQEGPVPVRCRPVRFAHRRAIRSFDRIIVPSRYLAGLAEGWGFPRAGIAVVPNTLGDLPEGGGGSHDPNLVLGVGRFVPWKHFEILIESLVRLPGIRLRMIGSGPEEDRLRARAHELGVNDRVEFAGSLSRSETIRRMAGAGAVVLPSTYEGWPHVLVEAMAVGTPVIAAAAGGTPELVRDGETGLLFPPGDVGALAAALRRLLEKRELAERLAAAARREILSRTWDDLVDRTRAILQNRDRCSVLMIGTNRSLLEARPGDDTVRRLQAYAARIDGLHVIVTTGRPPSEPAAAAGMEVIPVVSRCRLLRYGKAARAARRLLRGKGITHLQAQEPVLSGAVVRRLGRRYRLPTITVAYGIDPWDRAYRRSGPGARLTAPLARFVLRRSDVVQVDTFAARDRFAAAGLDESRIRVKPMIPPDLDRFAEISREEGRRRLGLDERPWILWIGRESRQKNLPMLRRVIDRILERDPAAGWILMGGAGVRDPGERIRVWPRADREEVRAAYAACTVVVVTSYYEGFARVYMESGAARRAVVSTPTAGASEVIEPGVSGRIVPWDDVAGFANAVVETLAGDVAEEYGRRLEERVRARLDGFDDIETQVRIWREVDRRN